MQKLSRTLLGRGCLEGFLPIEKNHKALGSTVPSVATLAKTQAGTRLSVTGDVPAAWRSASGAGWLGTVAGGPQGTAQLTCASPTFRTAGSSTSRTLRCHN